MWGWSGSDRRIVILGRHLISFRVATQCVHRRRQRRRPGMDRPEGIANPYHYHRRQPIVYNMRGNQEKWSKNIWIWIEKNGWGGIFSVTGSRNFRWKRQSSFPIEMNGGSLEINLNCLILCCTRCETNEKALRIRIIDREGEKDSLMCVDFAINRQLLLHNQLRWWFPFEYGSKSCCGGNPFLFWQTASVSNRVYVCLKETGHRKTMWPIIIQSAFQLEKPVSYHSTKNNFHLIEPLPKLILPFPQDSI